MKLTVANTRGKKIKIYDCMGKEITYVSSFDTKTCKIELFLTTKINGKTRCLVTADKKGKRRVKKVKTTIAGAYAILDGKRV